MEKCPHGKIHEECGKCNNSGKTSRRGFLKTAGLAAAGLGVSSFASGLNFQSSEPFSFTGSGRVEADSFVLGEDGPATSFSDIGGNKTVRERASDSEYDGILYREGWKEGGYRGLVFRDGKTFSHETDAGFVLQSVADHLLENFENGAKGGGGQIAIPRNRYNVQSQATIEGDGTKLVGGGEYQQFRRWTGPHWNERTDGNDFAPAFWPGKRWSLTNAGSGHDEPTMSINNKGAGDTLWIGGTGKSNSIMRIRGPPANSTRMLDFEGQIDDGFAHIGYYNCYGQFYLGSARPSILMNAPSTYAGNYPAQEELSVLRPRKGSENNTDGLVINDGFANNALDLGPGAGSVEVNVSNDKPFTVSDPVNGRALFQLEPQDLTASNAPAPSEEGVVAVHDGTDKSKGLYRSDPPNSQWVKMEDNTVTIAY